MLRRRFSIGAVAMVTALVLAWTAAQAKAQQAEGGAADNPAASDAGQDKQKSDKCQCCDCKSGGTKEGKHGHGHAHHGHAHHGHQKHRQGDALKDLIVGQIGRYMVLRSKVDLSHEDRDKICSVLGSHRQEIMKSVEDIWQKRNALEDSVLKGDDEQAVRAAADDVGKAIGDGAVVAAKPRGAIAPLFSDDEKQAIGHYISDTREAIEKFYLKATHGGHAGEGEKKDAAKN